MAMTTRKIYLLDGRPVSPKELIDRASEIDPPFNVLYMKTTSRAAVILQKYGHKVALNKQKENKQ